MKKIGALWLRSAKQTGDKYFSGTLDDLRGEIKIVAFKNGKKEKDNHPDFLIYLSEDEKDNRNQRAGVRQPADPLDDFFANQENVGQEELPEINL